MTSSLEQLIRETLELDAKFRSLKLMADKQLAHYSCKEYRTLAPRLAKAGIVLIIAMERIKNNCVDISDASDIAQKALAEAERIVKEGE